jgi:hypothetical protein
MGEKATGPDQGVIMVHVIDLIVFGQRTANIPRQVIVGFVTDTKNIGAGRFQVQAKAKEMGRKMG